MCGYTRIRCIEMSLQHILSGKRHCILQDFKISLASLLYICNNLSKDKLDSVQNGINTYVHIVPSYF